MTQRSTRQKSKAEITLHRSSPEKYTGTYQVNGDKTVVFVKDSALMVLAPGGDLTELEIY